MLIRTLIATIAVMGTAPAMARINYPVTIPAECFELAQREGVPTVITGTYQATKARLKLARLRDSAPMVHECREAVARARAAMQ